MSGHARGSLTKADLIHRLQGVPDIQGEAWLKKKKLVELLAAVFHFAKAEGITEEAVEKTLHAVEQRSRIAAHGRITTLKMRLLTVLGCDQTLTSTLHKFVGCCSVMHWRSTHLMNLLFIRLWGAAPESASLKAAPLFGVDALLEADQRELLDSLCGDAKAESRGVLQSLVLPEYVHKPHQHGTPSTGAEAGPSPPHPASPSGAHSQGTPWSEHAHRLVRDVLLHDGHRVEEATRVVSELRDIVHPKSGWTNAVQHMATQLQQNLEVHVQGAMMSRVQDYLHRGLQLPVEDEEQWGSHREALFKLVQQGTWSEATNMSDRLRTSLRKMRQTLQPGIPDGESLPRRCSQPLAQLLELSTFLTRHTPPPATRAQRTPAPPPPESPDMEGAAAAAGIDEKLAFAPTSSISSEQQQQQQATSPTTRSYAPLASCLRQHAYLDANVLSSLVPQTRLEGGKAKASQRTGRHAQAFDVHLEEYLPEVSARAVTKRRQEAQNHKRQKHKQRKQQPGGKVCSGKKRGHKKRPTAAHGCGGGSVARGLVPHSLLTDGVALSIMYRHEAEAGDVPPEQQAKQLREKWDAWRLHEADFSTWRVVGEEEEEAGPSTSAGQGRKRAGEQERGRGRGRGASKRGRGGTARGGGRGRGRSRSSGSTAGGGRGRGRSASRSSSSDEEASSQEWSRVQPYGFMEENEHGWTRFRWPAGEEDLLQKKPPVIAALDPGRANKFFASVRSTHPGDLRDREIAPSWRDRRTGAAVAPPLASGSTTRGGARAADAAAAAAAAAAADAQARESERRTKQRSLPRKEQRKEQEWNHRNGPPQQRHVEATVSLSHERLTNAQRQRHRRRQEKLRQQTCPATKACHDELSRLGGARSSQERFRQALEVQNRYFRELYNENIVKTERSKERMAAYSGARSAWDDSMARLLRTMRQGSRKDVPLVLAVGASKMPPQTRGVTKWSAPTKLRQALLRAIIRQAGGLEKERPVLLLPVNEYRTTLCCSKCGAHTVFTTVKDYRTHQLRESTRQKECPDCKQRWREQQRQQQRQQQQQQQQQHEGGSKQAWPGAGRSRVQQPHVGYQMHRDYNASRNLCNVAMAAIGIGCRASYLHR